MSNSFQAHLSSFPISNVTEQTAKLHLFNICAKYVGCYTVLYEEFKELSKELC